MMASAPYIVQWVRQRIHGEPVARSFASVLQFDAYIKAVRALGAVVTFEGPRAAVATA